jgi:hypothetical protein
MYDVCYYHCNATHVAQHINVEIPALLSIIKIQNIHFQQSLQVASNDIAHRNKAG